MPRDVVALVSADDFVSAVRVYSDRVNDLLRRSGVPALETIEICETHSLALLDAVVNAPETVIDLAGWWFARAIEVANETDRAPANGTSDGPVSMLAGTTSEGLVRAALGDLPDGERSAVILRDGYDLPPQAVGVALRRGAESAAELTALGRLHLVAAYDGVRVPDLSGHSGRTTVDLVSLSKLAEGTFDPPRAAPLRRHVGNCIACENVLEALSKGRRLAAGMPIIAMDDDARESLINRVSAQAEAVLPSHEAVLQAVDEDHDPGPVISPVVAVIALVLAGSLGLAIALVTQATSSPAAAPTTVNSFVPSPSASFPTAVGTHQPRSAKTVAPPPTSTVTAPVSRPPRHTTTPTSPSSTSAKPTRTAAAKPQISVSPKSGREGTTFTVSGSGFPPGVLVRLSYARGRSTSTAQAAPDGTFTGQLQADALLPGVQLVTAKGGGTSAHSAFRQRV